MTAILLEDGDEARKPMNWYRREEMRPGARCTGPAIVAEYSGTTVVPSGWQARIEACGSLVLSGPGGAA